MDFWTAFAAASAEYLGKSKQNSSKKAISSVAGKESEAYEPDYRQIPRRQSAGEIRLLDGTFAEFDGGRSPGLDEYTSDNSTLLSLQPWIFRKENFDEVEEGGSITIEDHFPRLTLLNPRSITPVSHCGRSRSSLRNRKARRTSVKSLNRAENSLIPQLYDRNFHFEDRQATPLPSPSSPPSPPARPFVVTDGKRIISKSSSDRISLCGDAEAEAFPADQGSKPCRSKRRCEEEDHERLNSFDSHLDPVRHGFFSLGVCVGLTAGLLSTKREVDRLNETLKQRENLVQDLQEELTIKDSFTVSELADETLKLQEQSKNFDSDVEEKICSSPKVEEEGRGDESMSSIEAELEAELEKLEISMNATSLEGKLSSLAEVEPDFVSDLVHGELRVEIGGDDHVAAAAAEPPANYAVSPRQLSLRLHEVIQSRLEDRIRELEAVLRRSRRQPIGGSTRADSDESPEVSQPLCLNLAGEALEAYHEAYEEFQRASEVEETAGSSEEGSAWSLEMSGVACVDFEGEDDDDDDDDGGGGGHDDDDDDDDDDEEERILIQQVLERARKGSPVVQNAQKMLSLGVVDCPWNGGL